MGPEFEVYITNRTGTIERRMFQYSDLEVVDPLSDSRTCRFKSPIHDINALGQSNVQHMLPLERFVKVFYRSYLVFWGPITKPIFNFADGSVEVNAHDPSIWWKYHHFSEDDWALDKDNPLLPNGAGLWLLADAANLNFNEIADGFADPGIALGVAEDYAMSGESHRLFNMKRGDPVWPTIQDVAAEIDGPDWTLVPTDENHDHWNVWVPGVMATFRAEAHIGRDLYLPQYGGVTFQYGFGRMNLENFIYEPDGLLTRNRQVIENQRGKIRVGRYPEGMERHGIMESWDPAPLPNTREGKLAGVARELVQAYGEPAPIFTIEPTWDTGLMGSTIATPYRYPSGYRPGDRLLVQAQKGEMLVELVGRVTKVTLTQVDAAENGRSQIELMPIPVAPTGDVDVEETVSS